MFERYTLKWINEQRDAMGLDPLASLVPGRRIDASHCVVANSLRAGSQILVSTNGSTWYTSKTLRPERLPFRVRLLVTSFDRGARPHLTVRDRLSHEQMLRYVSTPAEELEEQDRVAAELAALEAKHGFAYRAFRKVFKREKVTV
jgi:hypothetical protein